MVKEGGEGREFMRNHPTIIFITCLMVICVFSLGVSENIRVFERNMIRAVENNEGSNIYHKKKIYLSMAGSGDPWSALTRERRYILRALHDGLSLQSLADEFNMSVDQIVSEIKPMLEASLIEEKNKVYTPAFFIADLRDTEKVYARSKDTGKMLAEALLSQWDKLVQSYSMLSLSRSYSFDELGFMMVGSRILDIGLLGALARDKSILEPAPLRPSPGRPDSRYYFWMVEGKLEHLGRYGQNDKTFPNTNWHFLTFGQSWIGGMSNLARRAIEIKCDKLIKSYHGESPEVLAKELNVPFLTKEDSSIWASTTEKFSEILLKRLKEQSAALKQFFQTLRAGKHAPDSFGEFACWYIHLAFAWAIDALQEKGVLTIPSELFSAVILYREGPEGLLLGFKN